jgi:O-antigen/teichoic acid export membrane protein
MGVTRDAPPKGTQPRFLVLVLRLTSVNSLLVLLAFITSPILARVLGPVGRGEVAAIFSVVTIAPWIADLGVTAYLTVERAKGNISPGTLLGSVTPVALGTALIGVALSIPIAHLIGHGRREVVLFVEIGLDLLPLSVLVGILSGLAIGEQRWNLLLLMKVVTASLPAVGIVGLYLTHSLTVATTAITYLVAGIAALFALAPALVGTSPWRFQMQVARHGTAFGIRSWLSTVSSTANLQLDQLLMAALVSSRQLGLYALAVTLAGASSSLVGAVVTALVPRVAAGEPLLAARSCRVATFLVACFAVAIAAVSPIAIPLVFGSAFAGTLPMLLILAPATVLLVASQVLSTAVIAAGEPGPAARGQFVGLAITVPGLLVVLPLAGGIGAAWVSLVAYGATLGVVLRSAIRIFRLPARSFLIVNREDLKWLRTLRRQRMEPTRSPDQSLPPSVNTTTSLP